MIMGRLGTEWALFLAAAVMEWRRKDLLTGTCVFLKYAEAKNKQERPAWQEMECHDMDQSDFSCLSSEQAVTGGRDKTS